MVVVVIPVFSLCHHCWIMSYFIFILLVTHQTSCTFLDHFIFYLYLTGHTSDFVHLLGSLHILSLSYWSHIRLCAPSWITSYFIFILLVTHQTLCTSWITSYFIFILLVTHQTLCTFLDHFIFYLYLTGHTSNFVHLLGSLHILSLSYWSHIKLCAPSWITSYFIFILLVTHQTLCTFLDHFMIYPLSYWSHIKLCAPLGSLHILSFILLVTHQTLCTSWITSCFILYLTGHTSNFVHLLDHFIFYPLSYWSHVKLCAPSWIISCFILDLTGHTSNFVHLLGSFHVLSFILLVTHQTLCTSWITSYFILYLTGHTSNFVHLLGSLHILSFILLVTHQTLCTFLDHFMFYPLSYWSHIKLCAPSWITSYFIFILLVTRQTLCTFLDHFIFYLYLTGHTSNFVHLLGSLHILSFILPVTHQTLCTFLDHFIYQTLCTFLDHFIFDLISYFSCTHQTCTPSWITSYFILYLTGHTSNFIHSSSEKHMNIPKCDLKSFNECSFSFMAPSV